MSDVKNEIASVLQERLENALKDAAREMWGTIESTVDDAISTAISGVADEVADSLRSEIQDMAGSIDFGDLLEGINFPKEREIVQLQVLDFNVSDLVRQASLLPHKNFAVHPLNKLQNVTTWADFFLVVDALTKTNVDVSTMLQNLNGLQAFLRNIEAGMRARYETTDTIDSLFPNWSGR